MYSSTNTLFINEKVQNMLLFREKVAELFLIMMITMIDSWIDLVRNILIHCTPNENQILWILEVLVIQSLLYIVEVSHN